MPEDKIERENMKMKFNIHCSVLSCSRWITSHLILFAHTNKVWADLKTLVILSQLYLNCYSEHETIAMFPLVDKIQVQNKATRKFVFKKWVQALLTIQGVTILDGNNVIQ